MCVCSGTDAGSPEDQSRGDVTQEQDVAAIDADTRDTDVMGDVARFDAFSEDAALPDVSVDVETVQDRLDVAEAGEAGASPDVVADVRTDVCPSCPIGPHVASSMCIGGLCVPRCVVGFADCNGAPNDGCEIDLSSPASCGACGTECPAPPAGRGTCIGGSCGFACDVGYHACDGRCVSDASPSSCGARCDACPLPAFAATATCVAGACGFTCAAGFHACGSMCVDNALEGTCGTRCTPCPAPPNATPTCIAERCEFTCNPGYARESATCEVAAPRPLAPLAAARVNTTRPTFRWQLTPVASGARVEIARDRGFTVIEHSFDATGASGSPTAALIPGAHFWRLRARSGATVSTLVSPVWELVVQPRPVMADTNWGTLPDLNGDGLGDLVVPVSSPMSANAVAYVYLGRSPAPSATPSQTLSISAVGSSTTFALSIAIAPDVNGDGFADLVVGRPSTVLVFHGGPDGVSPTPNTTLSNPDTTRSFGQAVDGVGDVNGDGYGDIVAGGFGGDGGGRAYVYFGGPGGLGSAPRSVLHPPIRLARGASFGSIVSHAGDFDGDGRADVAVTATDNTRSSVCIFSGSTAGLAMSTCTAEVFASAGIEALECVDDFTADGRADLAFSGSARVHVIRGVAAGVVPQVDTAIFRPSGEFGRFGTAFASAGDVDGDGFDDVVVGSPTAPGFSRAHVFRGRVTATILASDWTVTSSDDTSGYFGATVAEARDMNGDTFPDLVIGSTGWRAGAGRTYQYFGTRSGPVELPGLVLESPGGLDFGNLLAWRGCSMPGRPHRRRRPAFRSHANITAT